LIILGSIKRLVAGKQFARRAQRVPGVVSDVRTTFAGRGEYLRTRNRPILTFTTADGREITTEASTTSDLGVGNATDVFYDPQDPTRAVPAESVGGGYSGIVIGLIAAVIGLAFFAGVWESPDKAQCEIQQADGSFEPADCPPGLDLDLDPDLGE
jgi:hypothetical protein